VGFLIIACIVTAIVALGFLCAGHRLSASGNELLRRLRENHRRTTQLVKSSAMTLSHTDLALAIGLFGAGMLAIGPLANVHAMLPRASGGGGCAAGGGGCSSGGGGGCGGGGGGGGGCGGGGCGGCGGG
jgi:hypothetical protein